MKNQLLLLICSALFCSMLVNTQGGYLPYEVISPPANLSFKAVVDSNLKPGANKVNVSLIMETTGNYCYG
jgi:hypothetical protein